jgi:hypothetical protein
MKVGGKRRIYVPGQVSSVFVVFFFRRFLRLNLYAYFFLICWGLKENDTHGLSFELLLDECETKHLFYKIFTPHYKALLHTMLE